MSTSNHQAAVPYSDGPRVDPLEHAAVEAARKLASDLPLDDYDWDALKQYATDQLQEHDHGF